MTAEASTQAAQASSNPLTLEAAAKAFEDWETAFRASPEGFYTVEETAAMEIATLSESRAIHFMALLRNQA